MKDVTIIIPCAQEALYIRKCIESIFALDFSEIAECEILVVDGMSTDGTRAIVREISQLDPRVKLLDNPKVVTASGLNVGIKAARYDTIVRCDAHSEYGHSYLTTGLKELERSGADVVGGPWIAAGRNPMSCMVAEVFQNGLFMLGAKAHDVEFSGEADTVYLGFYPRKSFERFGVFDEKILRNEDDEFNFRVATYGGRVWMSSAIRSKYFVRDNYRNLWRQYHQYGYWKLAILIKHGRLAKLRHYVPYFVIALGVFAIPGAVIDRRILWLIGALGMLYFAYTFVGSMVLGLRNRRWNIHHYWWASILMQGGYCFGVLNALTDRYILRNYPRTKHFRLTR